MSYKKTLKKELQKTKSSARSQDIFNNLSLKLEDVR